MEERARELASKPQALVVAAAGCGKTELLAKSVAVSAGPKRQLVLTHTHAGVRVLRERLKRLGVSPSLFRVETIDGFSLRYAGAFPKISTCMTLEPTESCDWVSVREACKRALENRHVRHVFERSYAGFYVDEYQDCTMSQHQLILRLAELLPCRAVGDPLQAIFGFDKNDPLPDWDREVAPHFERLEDLTEPHRWLREGANAELGRWLGQVRTALNGSSWRVPLLNETPVQWVKASSDGPSLQVNRCFVLNRTCGADSVVVMHNLPNKAHWFAKRLDGCYQSMEEVESKDLLKFCGQIEASSGLKRADRVMEVACKCIVRTKPLKAFRDALRKGRLSTRSKVVQDHPELLAALEAVARDGSFSSVAEALGLIKSIHGVRLHRREVFNDMIKTCRIYDPASEPNLRKTAWKVRDAGRRYGRYLPKRLVSRALLIKGLEFDHVIVLDADAIQNSKDLYVALTRATKSLTVFSKTPHLDSNQPR